MGPGQINQYGGRHENGGYISQLICSKECEKIKYTLKWLWRNGFILKDFGGLLLITPVRWSHRCWFYHCSCLNKEPGPNFRLSGFWRERDLPRFEPSAKCVSDSKYLMPSIPIRFKLLIKYINFFTISGLNISVHQKLANLYILVWTNLSFERSWMFQDYKSGFKILTLRNKNKTNGQFN